MTTCYKAVRPDGRDFYSGTVRWLPPVGEPLPDGGLVVRHPTARRWSNGAGAAAYLSVSTVATDCTGMEWPCRLAEVEKAYHQALGEPAPDAATLTNGVYADA